MTSNHTLEQRNLSTLVGSSASKKFDSNFCTYQESGRKSLYDICTQINCHLAFTREYEHAFGIITATSGEISISYLEMPHPSGIARGKDGLIYVLSTRTPHLLYRFRQIRDSEHKHYLIPDLIKVLPGCLYAHELLAIGSRLFLNATGLNKIVSLQTDFSGELRADYLPSFIPDGLANCMQLNSICRDNTNTFYSTCFSTIKSDFKPWKDEVGPINKGGIIRHSDDHVIVSNLTCPHSARITGNRLFYCNSGFGEVRSCNLDGSDDTVIATVDGFTRGLIIHDDFIFVGLSRVQEGKTQYAPGVRPESSKCGIITIDRHSGEIVNTIEWNKGAQIFDIQLIPNEGGQALYLPQNRDASLDDSPSRLFYVLHA
jgi:uncharacterized protein (TIGR03032 family)